MKWTGKNPRGVGGGEKELLLVVETPKKRGMFGQGGTFFTKNRQKKGYVWSYTGGEGGKKSCIYPNTLF